MVYAGDFSEIERFMRSKEGQEILEELRQKLEGAKIKSVLFSNEADFISITLKIEGGDSIVLLPPSLEIESIRECYAQVLQREYYRDFPERRPNAEKRDKGEEN